jgi:hypothetical protein
MNSVHPRKTETKNHVIVPIQHENRFKTLASILGYEAHNCHKQQAPVRKDGFVHVIVHCVMESVVKTT